MRGISEDDYGAGSSGLLLLLAFDGINDCIHQFQLLLRGAVQPVDLGDNRFGMYSCDPAGKFFLARFGFGIVYDHMDRGHFSDSGHLLLLIASAAVKFYSEIADNMKSGAYLAGQATPFSRPTVHIYYWLLWILTTDRLCYMPGTNLASGLPVPNRVPDVLLMPIS